MSLARVLAFGSVCALALMGCREQPECNERMVGAGTAVIAECSAGKVPVCGTEPEQVYNPMSGALLPTPSEALSPDGSCPDGVDDCRPRPTCGAAGDTVQCANGETAVCVLGTVREIAPRVDAGMVPDAGPPADDAGPGDPDGGTDGGADTDAGPETDAGMTDAGPGTDAG